ncbi:MAG: MogA/MoaB family molybdenum cofactor biosynthesis protein [Acidobacteria bacterium ACB2]|nr:MogA/MoaB family molybdenum cofactor biosynthesis protein [Acidobacteria bacterium ACB2]
MTGAARVAVLTVSDRSFRGERADASGPAVADAARRLLDAEVVELRVVPDERDDIEWNLRRLADTGTADIVLTTGGTGLGPRDVTPQATAAVLDYEVPGLAEAMRASSRAVFAAADLSRQIAGVRSRTLIVNLPGSPRGAVECLEVVAPALPHAVATLRGEEGHPARARGSREREEA